MAKKAEKENKGLLSWFGFETQLYRKLAEEQDEHTPGTSEGIFANKFEEMAGYLQNQLSKQEVLIKDANRDRLNLKQQLRRTEEECERLKKYEVQCKKSEARLRDLENQLSKQKGVIKDANRDRLNLKQELERTEEECERLKKYEVQCKKSEESQSQLCEDKDKIRRDKYEWRESLERHLHLIEQKDRTIKTLQDECERHVQLLQAMEEKQRELTISLNKQTKHSKQKETEWRAEIERIISTYFEPDLSILENEHEELQRKVVSSKEVIRQKEQEIIELKGLLEKEREEIAPLREENTRLQEALHHDRQDELLKKLHDDLQVVRTGMKDISGEVRKVNEQLPDPTSRVSELETENMSLNMKLRERDAVLTELRQQLAMTVKFKDRRLIEQVKEELREQKVTTTKEILSYFQVPSPAGVPHLDPGDKDEALDKEKLLDQVEDLQKQLKEKEEELNKTLSKLTEMSQERDSIERELKDTFSLQEETVKKLQDEVACQKSQTEGLSQKLARSKECIKALENMLTNLVLWEKPAEESVEQISSGEDSVGIMETVVPGPLAHETELKEFCWIPFGTQTLTVGQEGGLFPLQPQSKELSEDRGVIMLEVPENAVNTAVCDKLCIRYGVIVYGPFDVPEGYQLGTMAVYIYFEEDHTDKPVLLHLPHWAGKDGESSLKCAIAPHRLEEGEEKYKFRLTEDGDFHSTEGSGVIAIDSHCSLFVIVFGNRASSKFLVHSFEKEDVEGSTLDVVITYAHDTWCEILGKRYCTATNTCCVQFAFGGGGIIQARLKAEKGNGWESWINGTTQVALSDLEYTSCISIGKELEAAVTKRRWYPPSISCLTTYHESLKKSGDPTKAVLVVEGADRPMEFVCTAYKYRNTQGQLLQRLSLSPRSPIASVDNEYSDDKIFSSKNFMSKYMDAESLEVVQAEEIASRLEVSQTCPLPPRVCSSIRQASSDEDAARELFKHFQKQGTPDTIRSLCDVMTKLKGYDNMKRLGEKMKKDEDLLLPSEDI